MMQNERIIVREALDRASCVKELKAPWRIVQRGGWSEDGRLQIENTEGHDAISLCSDAMGVVFDEYFHEEDIEFVQALVQAVNGYCSERSI